MRTAAPGHQAAFLDVARLDDGRYCVQFIKHGTTPRTSHAADADAVVRQARHAGNLAVRTDDSELQHTCRSQQVDLIQELAEEREGQAVDVVMFRSTAQEGDTDHAS